MSTLAAVVAASALALAAGYALKAQCTGSPWDGREFARLCYNDIQELYEPRGIAARTFPYVDGEFRDPNQLVGGAIEYPVLTGVFMWFSGLFASDRDEFLHVTALLLALVWAPAAYLLARMVGARALLATAAPAVVFYAFHNWDLLAVSASFAGIWLATRGRPTAAAALLAVGGAFKLYPLLFLVPLVLERWFAGDRREAIRAGAAGAAVTAAINLPFIVINAPGWWATYAFHAQRAPNVDSTWGLAFQGVSRDAITTASSTLTALALVAVVAAGWRRARTSGEYPFLPVAGALLAAFMLFGKVQSPQYTLWILPFFALLAVPLHWWLAYVAVDVVVYVGIFRWYFDQAEQAVGLTRATQAMTVGVWMRAVLLAALVIVFLRSQRAPWTALPALQPLRSSATSSRIARS